LKVFGVGAANAVPFRMRANIRVHRRMREEEREIFMGVRAALKI
jgi:hypothetical protein